VLFYVEVGDRLAFDIAAESRSMQKGKLNTDLPGPEVLARKPSCCVPRRGNLLKSCIRHPT
jgi:hypothetical protein